MSDTPNVAIVPIETIEFPNTYVATDIHHTIPDRPDTGLSGSQFAATILNVPADQLRDNLVLQQCMLGNLPQWMRTFKPIQVSDGANQLVYFVSPDVLCIGEGINFLRVSLNGYTARHVVDAFGCMLPTKRIADQIWASADLKLTPQAMGASPNMTSTQTLVDHNTAIETQRADRNFNIITGHKKDIVYVKHLLSDRSRLAIYGWIYPSGQIIQGPEPNSTSHSCSYQDYSSSIRLVSTRAMLNNSDVNLYELLNNPSLAHLISDEGPFDATDIYK